MIPGKSGFNVEEAIEKKAAGSVQAIQVTKYASVGEGGLKTISETDWVAVEEPLEIRIKLTGGPVHRISVTMRTPGNDLELALGFLLGEAIIRAKPELNEFDLNAFGGNSAQADPNQIEIELDPSRVSPDFRRELKRFERNFYVSSSCGVCGKSSIESVFETTRYCDRNGPGSGPFFRASVLAGLPGQLRQAQLAFAQTGGLHASGLFTAQGEPVCVREDVGRHNALDKVIGYAFLKDLLPLSEQLLVLSGRVSFELVQKAAMAGIRVIVAVGAPSSLAIGLAKELDLSLIGFTREQRFNIYHGGWRMGDQ